MLLQEHVQLGGGDRNLPNGGGNALNRTMTDIAGSEFAGQAGLQAVGVAGARSSVRLVTDQDHQSCDIGPAGSYRVLLAFGTTPQW